MGLQKKIYVSYKIHFLEYNENNKVNDAIRKIIKILKIKI